MKVLLFTDFSKRINSTKRPDDTTALEKDLVIKADFGFENQNQSTKCSMTNPSFFLGDINSYTYMKAWDMYYFIDSIEFDINGAQYITCSLDVLATWKAQILQHNAFVVYSSSDYSPLLLDTRIPKLDSVREYVSEPYNTIFSDDPDNMYDLLWVSGEDGVRCYSCNADTVVAGLYSQASQSLIDNLCESWSDAQSCILYCRTYCLDNEPGSVVGNVIIGKVDTEVQGVKVNNRELCKQSIDNIHILVGGSYTDFRRYEFTTMSLYLPYVGTVALNVSDFVDTPTSQGHVNIDYVCFLGSGTIVYKVYNDDGKVIGTYNGVAGRAKPISIVSPFNGLGVLTSGGTALGASAAALATSSPVGMVAGIGAAIAGVAGMFSAIEEQSVSNVGSCDGSASELLTSSITLTVKEYASRIEPSNLNELAGRPCHKVRSLTGLTGYVQTAGFSANVKATQGVIEEINRLMDSGVYIE